MAEMMQIAAGIHIQHTPYRGAGPALSDAAAGHVPMLVSATAVAGTYLADGTLRMLPMTSAERSPNSPNMPAVAETYPDFHRTKGYGVIVPAGLPYNILRRMNATVIEVLTRPKIGERYRQMDLTAPAIAPDRFTR